MVQFLKIKFLIILKLNFDGGQFYKKNIKFWLLFQKSVDFSVVYSLEEKMVRNCVENFEWV